MHFLQYGRQQTCCHLQQGTLRTDHRQKNVHTSQGFDDIKKSDEREINRRGRLLLCSTKEAIGLEELGHDYLSKVVEEARLVSNKLLQAEEGCVTNAALLHLCLLEGITNQDEDTPEVSFPSSSTLCASCHSKSPQRPFHRRVVARHQCRELASVVAFTFSRCPRARFGKVGTRLCHCAGGRRLPHSAGRCAPAHALRGGHFGWLTRALQGDFLCQLRHQVCEDCAQGMLGRSLQRSGS
mmetsp:Transcript_2262/g.6490  ORF Transcript_2262/g.6490 Transcript_2262/m.6490 type:complete len:239 (-) Transcript_2262:2323-3039(-)